MARLCHSEVAGGVMEWGRRRGQNAWCACMMKSFALQSRTRTAVERPGFLPPSCHVRVTPWRHGLSTPVPCLHHRSTHLEGLLVKPVPSPHGTKAIAQGVGQSAGTAEPNFGIFCLAQQLRCERATLACAVDVQTNARQRRTQRLQPWNKGIGALIAGAVMQIGSGRRLRMGLQGFQPGQERRDTDASRNPDLPGTAIEAGHIKTTIRPPDPHGVPNLQALAELPGVVPQRLDLKADGVVTLVGTGDGEGVSALFVVKGDKGKLPWAMALPALVET